jgi:hypothetical protein
VRVSLCPGIVYATAETPSFALSTAALIISCRAPNFETPFDNVTPSRISGLAFNLIINLLSLYRDK